MPSRRGRDHILRPRTHRGGALTRGWARFWRHGAALPPPPCPSLPPYLSPSLLRAYTSSDISVLAVHDTLRQFVHLVRRRAWGRVPGNERSSCLPEVWAGGPADACAQALRLNAGQRMFAALGAPSLLEEGAVVYLGMQARMRGRRRRPSVATVSSRARRVVAVERGACGQARCWFVKTFSPSTSTSGGACCTTDLSSPRVQCWRSGCMRGR